MLFKNGKNWLALIFIFSIALHFFFLTDVANRVDEREVFIWGETPERTFVEPYPPGFNFFVEAIFSFTQSVFWTRFVLMLFSSFAIVFLFLVAKQLFDSRIALWAAAFLAVSPVFAIYASHLRAYGMLLLIFLITTFFLLRILSSSPRRTDQVGLTVFYALGFWFHYYAFLFLVVHAIIVLVKRRKDYLQRFVVSALASLLFFIPLISIVQRQLFIVQSAAEGYFSSPFSTAALLSVSATFLFFFIPLSKSFFLSSPFSTAFVIVFELFLLFLFVLGLKAAWQSKNTTFFLLLFGMLFFLVLGFLLQKIHFWPRYAIPSLSFWMLALAVGVWQQKRFSPRLLGWLVLIGFLVTNILVWMLIQSSQFGLVYY